MVNHWKLTCYTFQLTQQHWSKNKPALVNNQSTSIVATFSFLKSILITSKPIHTSLKKKHITSPCVPLSLIKSTYKCFHASIFIVKIQSYISAVSKYFISLNTVFQFFCVIFAGWGFPVFLWNQIRSIILSDGWFWVNRHQFRENDLNIFMFFLEHFLHLRKIVS